MEFNTSDNNYKPIKSHQLGNASSSVQKVKYGCKICENDEVGLYWLSFQNFPPFPPFQHINYCQTQLKLPTNCKNPSLNNKTNSAFLESEIVVEIYWPKIYFYKSGKWAHSQDISHPRASSPTPPPQGMQNLMHMSHIVFFSSKPSF